MSTEDEDFKAEAERARAIQSAKLAALGEMAAGVAHEINTPLALIAIKAGQAEEILQSGQPDLEALKKANQSILATVGRISKIVRSLRSFARDGSQDEMISLPVAELLSECSALCAERFRINGVFYTEKPGGAPYQVRCRPTEIVQVLLSLLNNAFDAVLPMLEKWIKIEADERGGWLEIAVSDSGPGVPEALRGRIFEPFFTSKPQGQGTGMGLSISRSIARTHGGTLEYDPSLNCSRFVLRLPGLGCPLPPEPGHAG
jgi:C4-dicarboxylate-specific signal transduction histidine kinase